MCVIVFAGRCIEGGFSDTPSLHMVYRTLWSAKDIADLRHEVADHVSLEEAASHLGRSGTQSEVAAKAKELGLRFHSERFRRNSFSSPEPG